MTAGNNSIGNDTKCSATRGIDVNSYSINHYTAIHLNFVYSALHVTIQVNMNIQKATITNALVKINSIV